ncbi:MAG: hypothetical protein ACH344_07500 [Yersinia sp. (in: enterobacteria)]
MKDELQKYIHYYNHHRIKKIKRPESSGVQNSSLDSRLI